MNDAKDAFWERCLSKIKAEIPSESYSTWFLPTRLHSMTENDLTIIVPNNFYKECLQQNYHNVIRSALDSLTETSPRFNFKIVPNDSDLKEERSTLKQEKGDQQTSSATSFFNAINPKYSFSNFVVGASNQFAHAAASSVANNPTLTYNPLFLYGGVGLGKTHLLHAMGNAILKNDPQARIRYLSAESFTVDLIESLKKDDMPAFRNRYRPLDILFVDDIQFLAGKDRTQEEFFYTFNTLYESHRQVVLSSDKYPKDIRNIEERLSVKYKNRFKIVLVPNITNICYGRGVGYKIEELVLPEKIQNISATKIRKEMRKKGKIK